MGQTSQGRNLVGAGCGYALDVQGLWFLLKKGSDAVDDLIQRSMGAEAGEGVELIDGGHAAHHVLEARFVGLVVRHVLNGRGAAGAVLDSQRQSFDGDFLGVADVDDLADGALQVHETDETFDGVADIAEAARLLSAAVDADGGVVQGGLDEIGEHHSVATGLPGTDGVEQASHDDGQLLLLPVGKSEKLIERLGGGVAPAAFCGRAEDEVGIFVEGNVGVLAVDLGGGGGENEFLFFAGGFEDQLRAVDIGFDGFDGTFDDEFDANGGGQMDDHIGIIYEFSEQLTILDVVEVILHAIGRLEMADVFDAACGEVVEQNDAVAAVEKALGEMRTNKTSAASDQIAQRASIKGLGVIVIIIIIAGNALGDGFGIFFMLSFSRFLGAISARVWIIAVRVVVIRGAGIHGVEDHTEDSALDAIEQVAGASESFLGCFAAANDEKNAVSLHRKNHGIGGSHYGRGIDDDKLELGAQLGNSVGEFM